MERISREENRAAGIAAQEAVRSSRTVSGAVNLTRAASDYSARLLSQRCVRNGCRAAPLEGSGLCQRHRDRERKAGREAQRRLRASRRDAGLCACGCGAASSTWLAPACAIRLDRVPRTNVSAAVNLDPFRRDNDGWERYRGRGKRGAPPAIVSDLSDLAEMAKVIERAREAFIFARSAEVAAQGTITKRAAIAAAVALVGLVERFGDDIRERNEPK